MALENIIYIDFQFLCAIVMTVGYSKKFDGMQLKSNQYGVRNLIFL